MRFILLIGHGSRDEEGNEEVRQFAENLIRNKSLENTETCFLEFGKPDIMEGMERCIDKGATEIIVIPIILLPAGHSKIHIPEAIDKAKQKFPQIKFYYGTPVGSDEQVLDILTDRIKPGLANTNYNTDQTAVIIIGRGSSDPDANSTLFRISRLFWEKHRFEQIETAFMGITQPGLMESLEKCQKLGAKNIFVLPYFLFTGVLIQRMKKMVADFSHDYNNINVHMLEYFGFHHLLEDIIIKKIKEAVDGIANLNCDLCQYRANHDHDHNHSHEHVHRH